MGILDPYNSFIIIPVKLGGLSSPTNPLNNQGEVNLRSTSEVMKYDTNPNVTQDFIGEFPQN